MVCGLIRQLEDWDQDSGLEHGPHSLLNGQCTAEPTESVVLLMVAQDEWIELRELDKKNG